MGSDELFNPIMLTVLSRRQFQNLDLGSDAYGVPITGPSACGPLFSF